jgi:anti-sigma B factor antagonist
VSGFRPTPFAVSVDERDDCVVVCVRGELDLANAAGFEEAILPPVRAGRHAVVDLRNLEFMDSSGVRVIVGAHLAAAEHGGRLSLVRLAPGTPIQRVLSISGLDDVLDVVDAA